MPTVTTDDFVNFATDKPEKKSRVINLSQYGPTYFGQEHAQVFFLISRVACLKERTDTLSDLTKQILRTYEAARPLTALKTKKISLN